MTEVLGGVTFFVCSLAWLGLGGYSFGKAVASGELSEGAMGAMFGFCLFLAPFAFGYSVVADMHKKKETKE